MASNGNTPAYRRAELRGLDTRAGRVDPALRSGGSARALQVEALANFATKALEPKVEQERMRKYVEGMRMAQEGATMEEIKQTQPAWSRLFGESDAVTGGAFYTSQSVSTQIRGQVDARMPELAQMDFDSANAVINDMYEDGLTGHALTDKAILEQYIADIPMITDNLVKNQVQYQQQHVVQSWSGAVREQSKRLAKLQTQLHNGDFKDPNLGMHLNSERMNMVQLLEKPEGMDQNQWANYLIEFSYNNGMDGNYLVADLIRTSGLLDEFPADMVSSFQDKMYTAEMRNRGHNLPFKYASRMNDIERYRKTNPTDHEGVAQQMEELNYDYKLETGALYGLYDRGDILKGFNQMDADLERIYKENAKKYGEEEAERREIVLYGEMARRGQLPSTGKFDKDLFNSVYMETYFPEGRGITFGYMEEEGGYTLNRPLMDTMESLWRYHGHTIPEIKNHFDQFGRVTYDPDSLPDEFVNTAYELAHIVRDNPELAKAYVSKDVRDMMMTFYEERFEKDNAPRESYIMAMNLANTPEWGRVKPSDRQIEDYEDKARDLVNRKRWWNWGTGSVVDGTVRQRMSAEMEDELVNNYMHHFDHFVSTGATNNEAWYSAMQEMDKRYQRLGKVLVENEMPNSDTLIDIITTMDGSTRHVEYIGDAVYDLTEGLLKDRLKSNNIKYDGYRIYQYGDTLKIEPNYRDTRQIGRYDLLLPMERILGELDKRAERRGKPSDIKKVHYGGSAIGL